MRFLIKLALLLLAAILVYNYFFGTGEEKAQSKEVFKKTGDALGAAWNILKSEKQKFDAGKYDRVLDQLGGAYKAIRERAQYVDEKVLRRLDELERRKTALEQQLDSLEAPPEPVPARKKGLKSTAGDTTAAKQADQQRRKEALQRELDRLIQDTDALLKQAREE